MLDFDAWFWVWAITAAMLLVGEIFTAGFFMLPFGVGAGVAAVAAVLGADLVWQWVAFIAVSAIAFVLSRRVVERLTHEPPERTGANRLVGKTGVVLEVLEPHGTLGRVRIDREEWRADPSEDVVIPSGARVIVEAVEGAHLVVRAAGDQGNGNGIQAEG